jgi:hypothetical protein
MSQQETDMIKIPRVLLERFTEALCYAAELDKVKLREYRNITLQRHLIYFLAPPVLGGFVTSPFCLTRMLSNRHWTSILAASEEDCLIQGTECGIGCCGCSSHDPFEGAMEAIA